MATLSDSGWPNMANWAATQMPGGGVGHVTDVLSERNDVLDDVPWVEGNLPTGHRIIQTANSLPSGSWRTVNAGVTRTKTEHAQYDEVCGVLEDNSEVDTLLADLNGVAPEYRRLIDSGKVEGLGQQFCDSLFYESTTTNPDRIHGLAPRYPASSGYTASSYVKVGTNAGTNARSVWLITWEPLKVYGIYPKASQMGLKVNDKGEQRVLDSNSNPYYAYCTNLQWKCGIAVEDYRYAVRFQWDPDDAAFADDDRGMYLGMQDMFGIIHRKTPNTRFYMDRTSWRKLHAQLASNDANFLGWVSPRSGAAPMSGAGLPIETFLGVPIRINDALVAETAIS